MSFEICSLRVGDLVASSGSGAWRREPVHCWYVTDGSSRLLVDSGMPSAAEVKAKWKVDATGGGPEALRACLAEVGTAPDEIEIVILTHLHFDHAWSLELFPHARVIVQRDELFHAIDPVPSQRLYYTRQVYLDLLQRKRGSHLQLVDGDTSVVPGVTVLKVAGHTPGMQVAIVATARGNVGLVSDLGENYGCWYPDDPRATDAPASFMRGSLRPPSIRSDGELLCAASMRRVLAQADIIVPAHDERIPPRMPEHWFRVPGEDKTP